MPFCGASERCSFSSTLKIYYLLLIRNHRMRFGLALLLASSPLATVVIDFSSYWFGGMRTDQLIHFVEVQSCLPNLLYLCRRNLFCVWLTLPLRANISHAHAPAQHRRLETWFCFMCGPQRTVSANSTKQQPALSCFPSFKSLKQYLFFEIASTSLFSFNCNNSHLNNDGSTSLFLHRAPIQQQWWYHSHVPCPVDHAPASREAAMPKDELGGSSCPKRACQCLFLTLSHDC